MGSSCGLEWFFAAPFLPQIKPNGWVFYSAKSLKLGFINGFTAKPGDHWDFLLCDLELIRK
jgi:hypothetical protein